ncbi:heme ABC transporter ATP-binding protein (plasmid) [Pedobacter sp. BS3]|uniref:heme ABC transporter ATP-binding protein n=1 Tax=Pedobacter sp. BS3 TaxID=2567937 RepID=UPI0011EF6ECE|nr:heme ABC transporter ATP-binding protein [Pedobacter sp. BS3]TZF85958.1 heme ABC transporter ATP-binding protein [Pedobacter sp. BS3]
MIIVDNISYRVGKNNLLKNVGFRIHEGEMLVIIGANGAGKSTLLKLLCGDQRPHSGSIMINDSPLSQLSSAQLAAIRAVLSQHNTLSISFTVRELVMMGRYPHYELRPRPIDYEIADAVMAETGIAAFAERDYGTLSGGEQQRVQLARVIAQIYDVPDSYLFLDEPVNGLDLLYQQRILNTARLLANKGHGVVCVLHDINLAARFADKILILKKGEMIAYGLPSEVITCENIHQAFGINVRLMDEEHSKCPLVIPAVYNNN